MKSHLQSANEKSFLPYRQKKGKQLSLYKETLPLLLKELRRRFPLAPSSLARPRLRLRLWIQIWQMMWLIDKVFGQNLFNQFLLNQINPVNIISYKFAGNSNIPKSRYFPKNSYFSNRHNFSKKLLFFPKDTTFWINWV